MTTIECDYDGATMAESMVGCELVSWCPSCLARDVWIDHGEPCDGIGLRALSDIGRAIASMPDRLQAVWWGKARVNADSILERAWVSLGTEGAAR